MKTSVLNMNTNPHQTAFNVLQGLCFHFDCKAKKIISHSSKVQTLKYYLGANEY